MSDNQYKLMKTDRLLSHMDQPIMVVRDTDSDEHQLEIDALVASGDCFAMLATALDQLTGESIDDRKLIKPQLEKCIHTLLYLQRYYQINHKPPEFRQ